MSRTRKIPPKQNLHNIPVLINDTNFYSVYFELNDLNRVFHSGRNGFLIRGSQFLRKNSNIGIEILDRYGVPIFATPVPGYNESGARLVSIEIFEDTPEGAGTLTIIGEADRYPDGSPVPPAWRGRYNVKWSVPVQISPAAPNITKIRLANSPISEVTEKNFVTTVVTQTVVTSSFFTASLVYDFEGQKSDGYAISMVDSSLSPVNFFSSSQSSPHFTGSLSKTILSKTFDSGTEVAASRSVLVSESTSNVYLPVDKLVNDTTVITNTAIKFSDNTEFLNGNIHSGNFEIETQIKNLGNNIEERIVEEYTSSVVYKYIQESVAEVAATSSLVNFRIPFVSTTTGTISKVKISAKEANSAIGSYQPFAEFAPGYRNILIQTSSIGDVDVGIFSNANNSVQHWFSSYMLNGAGTWNSSSYENNTASSGTGLSLITSSDRVVDGVYSNITASNTAYFVGTNFPIKLYENVEYTLKYSALYSPTRQSGSTFTTDSVGDIDVYLTRIGSSALARASSSVIITDDPYGKLVDEVTTSGTDKSLYERQINFQVEKTGLAYLRFVVNSGFWDFGNITISPAFEKGYNPDEIIFDAENNFLANSTNIFKIEFLDFEDSPIDYNIVSSPIFLTGSRTVKNLRLISDRSSFVFDSNGLPAPANQTASFELSAQNITTTSSWSVVNDADVAVNPSYYKASSNTFELYVTAFGNPVISGSALVTVSADGLTDKSRIIKIQDGGVGSNATQYVVVPLDGTAIKNNSGSLEVQVRKLDGSLISDPSSGNIKLRKYETGSLADLSTVAGVTAGTNGIQYNAIISSSAINGRFDVAAVDTANSDAILDTITLIDVTDGIPVGSVTPSNGLILLRERPSNTFTPSTTSLTASFYDRDGTEYIELIQISASYSDPDDRLRWTYLTNDSNISTAITNAGGTTVSENTWESTKALNFTFTFTDPAQSDTMSVSETIVIASDGIDGVDGSIGVDAKTATLTVDDYQVAYNSASQSPDPTSVLLSGSSQNFTSPIYRFENDTDASVLRDWSPIPSASYSAPAIKFKSKTFTLKVAETGSTTVEAIDSVGIFGTQDGTDGITVILSNEAHSFAAESDGTVSDYSNGGTIIEVYQGNSKFIVDNSSLYQTGSFRIGALTGSNINSGSVLQIDGNTSASIGAPSNMTQNQATITIPITIKTLDYQNLTINRTQTFTKSLKGVDGTDGSPSVLFYIEPLSGRSFKTTSSGTTSPSQLIFVTRQVSGSSLNAIVSGSSFGLYFSGSLQAVSGSAGSSVYTVTPSDITDHDVLLYKSGSGAVDVSLSNVVDTIDITDLTDGVNPIVPLLTVDGIIAFRSSSSGITPATPTGVTGSLISNGTTIDHIYLQIVPNVTELSSSFITASSPSISSSFSTTSSPVYDLTVDIYSGSASPTKVLSETFVVVPDGYDGTDGINAGYVTSTNGTSFVRDQSNVFSPSNTKISASFYDIFGSQYNELLAVTASYSAPNDQLVWSTLVNSPEITTSVTDAAGSTVTATSVTNTKIFNIVFTFTDPYTSTSIKSPITVQIVSDGSDGSDGSHGAKAKTARLIANNYVVSYDSQGLENPSSQTIGLTGSAYNHDGRIDLSPPSGYVKFENTDEFDSETQASFMWEVELDATGSDQVIFMSDSFALSTSTVAATIHNGNEVYVYFDGGGNRISQAGFAKSAGDRFMVGISIDLGLTGTDRVKIYDAPYNFTSSQYGDWAELGGAKSQSGTIPAVFSTETGVHQIGGITFDGKFSEFRWKVGVAHDFESISPIIGYANPLQWDHAYIFGGDANDIIGSVNGTVYPSFTGTVYYEFLRNSVSKQNTTSSLYEVPDSDEPTSNSSVTYTLKTREGSSTGSVVATDTISLIGVKEGTQGEDSITVVLTNETHTFPADPYGVISTYNNGGTRILVWQGTQSIAPDQFAPYASPSFRVSASGSGITPNASPVYSSASVNFGNPNSMAAETASIDYNIFVRNTAGTDFTFTKIQTFSKTRAGQSGSAGISGSSGIPATSVDFLYNDLDTTGYAAGDGGYSLLTGSVLGTGVNTHTKFLTTIGLLFNVSDASGSDHSSYYDTLVPGDSAVFWISPRRWYAFQITSTGSQDPSSTRRRYSAQYISSDTEDGQGNISTSPGGQDVHWKFSRAQPGPGIVYRGTYNAATTYYHTSIRRDVVGYGGSYYITNNTSKNGLATWGTPPTDWDSFGAEFTSVATDILFAQDVYANRTINVGSSGSTPLISLDSDYSNSGANPSIKMVATGYNTTGIFLGYDSSTAKLSLKSGTNSLLWDGTNLTINGGGTFSGTLAAAGGDFGSISAGSISIGSFVMTSTGQLTASAAQITGKVTATSGQIGGWTIGSSTLTGGSLLLDSSAGKIYAGSGATTVAMQAGTGFWAGATAFASAPYSVSPSGQLIATNATLSGSIAAQDGTIGGLVITSDRLAFNVSSTGSGTTIISNPGAVISEEIKSTDGVGYTKLAPNYFYGTYGTGYLQIDISSDKIHYISNKNQVFSGLVSASSFYGDGTGIINLPTGNGLTNDGSSYVALNYTVTGSDPTGTPVDGQLWFKTS